MSNSIPEIEDCPFLLCVGTNMTECHPIIAVRVKKALHKGARLFTVDPREIPLAKMSEEHLRLRIGTDTFLFNAMANVIIEEELFDREFVEARTEGFEELAEYLRSFTLNEAEKVTGVPAEQIRRAAIGYASAERAGIYYTLGVTEHICGVGNVQSLCNLALLTGNLGKKSAGINPLRGQNNIQGAGDAGALPNNYPGYQPCDQREFTQKFEKAWGVPLDPDKGITKMRALDWATEGAIKGMWICGENTLVSDPDVHHTRHALESLDFLIVQDMFLTDTAKVADVVFPAAAFTEVDGFFTNSDRRVQRIRQAVPPPGEAKPDWWIISQVAKQMGTSVHFDYNSAEEVFDELCNLSPIYHGLNYERIDKGALHWPVPTKDHPGTPYLHEGEFPRGRGKLHCVEYCPPAEVPDEEFPWFLTTGRRLATYHTNTMTGRASGLSVLAPNEWLELHPLDADELQLRSNDWVKVSSRRGELLTRVKVTKASPPGTMFMSFAFPEESPTNFITNPEADPITETPELKVAAIRVDKADPPDLGTFEPLFASKNGH